MDSVCSRFFCIWSCEGGVEIVRDIGVQRERDPGRPAQYASPNFDGKRMMGDFHVVRLWYRAEVQSDGKEGHQAQVKQGLGHCHCDTQALGKYSFSSTNVLCLFHIILHDSTHVDTNTH